MDLSFLFARIVSEVSKNEVVDGMSYGAMGAAGLIGAGLGGVAAGAFAQGNLSPL